MYITSPNAGGNGSGDVLRLDRGMVATSPKSSIFSLCLVVSEKSGREVSFMCGMMLSMFLKPNPFLSRSIVYETSEDHEERGLCSLGIGGLVWVDAEKEDWVVQGKLSRERMR